MEVAKVDKQNSASPVVEPQDSFVIPPMYAVKRQRRRGLLAFYQSWLSALEALRANKLRSLLTSLGIIIGVGAVIMMVAVSESNSAVINQRLSNLNPNELVIRSGSASSGGIRQGAGTLQTVTQSDADALASQLSHVTAVSPVINSNGGQVIFGNQNWSTQVQGVYPTFQQLGSWNMQEGSFFTDSDEQSGTNVAVVGQTVVDNLFTPVGVDPIGQEIRIRNIPFTIVGVLAPKGSGGSFNDPDDVIYVPFATAQQRLVGNQKNVTIDVLVDNSNNLDDTQVAIQQLLEQRHHISNSAQDDFTIQNQAQILQKVQATAQSLFLLLVSVAAISLVVGGIGIMNIMLVSVTERTREIGIRIAIGAHPGDVMMQFLVEALILSTLGGVIGILIGGVGAFIVAMATSRPFVLNPLSVLLAFGFSAAVGIIFGFYPARRAARLDPIVALRTE